MEKEKKEKSREERAMKNLKRRNLIIYFCVFIIIAGLSASIYFVSKGLSEILENSSPISQKLKSYLGIIYNEHNSYVIIEGVIADSPAENAGLKSGDIILSINDIAVVKSGDVSKMISQHKPGDKMEIKILRENKIMTLMPALGKRL